MKQGKPRREAALCAMDSSGVTLYSVPHPDVTAPMNDSENQGRGKPPGSPDDGKTRMQARGKPAAPDATAFQPRGTRAVSASPGASVQPPTSPALQPAKAEVQLTRIRQAIREQNSSQGFVHAKQAADKALATNKIILNHRFVLEATLGAGGMGTVYRAKDLRKVEASDPNPYVAVKVLNDEFKNHPDAFVTLQREASRSHILSHPNIVTVHDFDRDGEVIYMTMELLQGQGLENLIRQHRGRGLPKDQALKIIRDFGQALAYAHQKHIVHSDLKPGNIFVSADGAKVLDFGIARLTNQAAASGDFDAGSLGALTPAYASLEMLNGEEPHPGDDVYAAAIIAYELFTGEHPYQRKSADVALQEKLRPAPIKSLSKQQWRTLASGLKLRRAERLSDISRFYKGLTQKRRSIAGLLVGTVVVSALAATVAYRWLAGDQLEPRIVAAFQQGQNCLQQNDFSCAMDSARAVLQLSPDHAAAEALLAEAQAAQLRQREGDLANEFARCIESGDADCAADGLQRLRELSPQSAQIETLQLQLLSFKDQRERQQLLRQAQDCLAQADFTCAVNRSERILAAGASADASALLAEAQQGLQQQQLARMQREQDFRRAFDAAEQCLRQKDYDCAGTHAQSAQAADIDDARAQNLMQKVEFARSEYQNNLQKAQNVLAKGRVCFDKKNYSCAIANAESALEFMPDFRPALQLRQEAQTAVEQLKKQITIE